MTDRLADYLLQHQQHIRLSDVAYTLQTGRHHFPHKRVILGSDTADMLQALNQRSKEVVKTASSQTSVSQSSFFSQAKDLSMWTWGVSFMTSIQFLRKRWINA